MNTSQHVRSSRIGLGILVTLLLGALALRLWDLGGPSVWHDEAWSIFGVREPITTPEDNTPPGYYAIMHVLSFGIGESPFALRYATVLFDLITITLVTQIMRRWFTWDTAVLAAAFLVISPIMWAYAREIRTYVTVPLLALLVLWQTDALLALPEPFAAGKWRRVWAGLLITELAFLYTHNLSVPVIIWLNLVIGAVWVKRCWWRALAIWGGAQIGLFIVYIPWLMTQSPSGTPLNTPPKLVPGLVWDIWQAYFAPIPAIHGAENALMIGSAVFGIAAVCSVGVILTWNRTRRTLLLLSQAVMLPLLSSVLLMAAHIDFHPRYYVAAVPAALMLVAVGVDSLPAPAEFRQAAIPGFLALACWVGAASLIKLVDDPKYQHDDFRALAGYYSTLPDDALVVIPFGWEPTLAYYSESIDIKAELLGIDLHSSAETAVNAINTALEKRDGPVHVELLTWFQLPADVRGMYPCLLESAGRREGNAFTVQGITTQAYVLDHPISQVEVTAPGADYGRITLTGSRTGGEKNVCVRSMWALEQSSGDDWRVAGRIVTTDPPGWFIARSDSDIRTDDQAPTSTWDAGEQGDAFSLLRFPAGAPPGDYEITFTVYSTNEPDGLDRLVNGIPSGKAAVLAAVQPIGTTDTAGRILAGEQTAVTVNDDITLLGHDARPETLHSGQELRVTLRWQASESWTQGTLALRGDGWELSQPVAAYPVYSLDWHAFRIPPDASDTAVLTLEADGIEPVTLVTYTVEKTDRLFVPPPFDTAVGAIFNRVAVLEGFSVDRTTTSTDEPLELTLIWKVTDAPGTSYRVFTHLLDTGNRVIAQHDGFPVDGDRLTTSWMPDEYITDQHVLAFQFDDYTGPAHLEVGLYNPETGYRVPLSNGADHIILSVEITVQ
ncbi:MAG: hypothetical protein JW966_16655 [Anaerolineae bacterium]|nr:hypothetical protein [Anaerolineae bacterium]